jgi:hypothetical protein
MTTKSFLKRGCALAVAAFIVGGVSAQGANLINNGSFEFGNFVPDIHDSMLLGVGATDITGWTVQNGGLAWDGPTNPYGLTAADGSYFLDLSGDHNNPPWGGVVSQTIPTVVGGLYRLSLDLGNSTTWNGKTAVSVAVTAGSASTVFTTGIPTGRNVWEFKTFDFTATSANTAISVVGQPAVNVMYIGLDNLSLERVPEPSTMALLGGSGLLLLAWRRFRKA